jgi:hypothetical protein
MRGSMKVRTWIRIPKEMEPVQLQMWISILDRLEFIRQSQ